tara:strand:+ start:17 stop:889 length:873 start_codon:yes stop_codon:yes gene_type:complete
MIYYLYHIPGKKIGVTRDLEERVTNQQGYEPHEYEVLYESEDIDWISELEINFQKAFGYRVDMKPYNKLNNNKMKINVTEQTTTFPCPVNKLKGRLMDNMGLTWETDHGNFHIDQGTILWILKNVKTSQFSNERCYVYNKAFSRYYDNHFDHRLDSAKQVVDQYNGKTRSGALSPAGTNEDSYECCDEENPCECMSQFDLIREWANERGLYDKGDVKTQTLKLLEEAGEICRAVLKDDKEQIIDGIGDCVVVLTNLAELNNISIEDCIDAAYNEISNRTGKMVNGTFKKD